MSLLKKFVVYCIWVKLFFMFRAFFNCVWCLKSIIGIWIMVKLWRFFVLVVLFVCSFCRKLLMFMLKICRLLICCWFCILSKLLMIISRCCVMLLFMWYRMVFWFWFLLLWLFIMTVIVLLFCLWIWFRYSVIILVCIFISVLIKKVCFILNGWINLI